MVEVVVVAEVVVVVEAVVVVEVAVVVVLNGKRWWRKADGREIMAACAVCIPYAAGERSYHSPPH